MEHDLCADFSRRLLEVFPRDYRPEREKGALSEAWVQYLLCSTELGEVAVNPSLEGRTPDLLWTIYEHRLFVEVVYGYDLEQAIAALRSKAITYDVSICSDLYVVALVAEALDLEMVLNKSGLRESLHVEFGIKFDFNAKTSETVSEKVRVDPPESPSYADLLLLLEFPQFSPGSSTEVSFKASTVALPNSRISEEQMNEWLRDLGKVPLAAFQ